MKCLVIFIKNNILNNLYKFVLFGIIIVEREEINMEIIVGKTAGFCFGVKRAVEGSLEQVNKDNKNIKIYCLGELVHNKQVIQNIENKGIQLIDDIDDVKEKEAKVIIRAHGIKKEIYQLAQEKQIELIDYTCPYVLKIHEIAQQYKENGYYIFVVGSKIHPEIIGTVSYCGENSYIIENEEDIKTAIENFKKTKINKLLVIVQTTFSEKKFETIEEKIRDSLDFDVNLVVKNTICAATSQRQKETENLSKQVDFMIIIGGKNSSNTKKLYEIAKKNCTNTLLIETADEIDVKKIKEFKKIGIMAGASTPQESIDDVVNILNT